MLPIKCIRCHRPYLSGAHPRPGVRCPVCRGRLEVDSDPGVPVARSTEVPDRPPVVRAEPGSYDENPLSFPSLVEFVNDDPRRGPSREVDVGLHWLDAEGHTYRAAWIADTGELYLVQTGDREHGGGHVELLGCAPGEGQLLRRLGGWERQCGRADSAGWLRGSASERLDAPVMPLALQAA